MDRLSEVREKLKRAINILADVGRKGIWDDHPLAREAVDEIVLALALLESEPSKKFLAETPEGFEEDWCPQCNKTVEAGHHELVCPYNPTIGPTRVIRGTESEGT